MDRRDYFYRQPVTEAELDAGFDGAENADWNMIADLALGGVLSGLGVTESSPADLTVQVAAGTAYDPSGRRMRVPTTQPLSIALDSNGVSTTVGSGGNAKVVSVFLAFARATSDPRTDGNSNTVYHLRSESFAFVVRQGVEAVLNSEAAPALEADKILLADIKRTFGQTQILTASINPYATNRRQDLIVGAGGLLTFRSGSIKAVLEQLRNQINEAVITPASTSGTSNDYSPTGFTAAVSHRILLRQDISASATLNGLVAKGSGQVVRLAHIGSNAAHTITLAHENAGSVAANRIICPNLANFTLRAGGSVDLFYDGVTTRWRVMGA